MVIRPRPYRVTVLSCSTDLGVDGIAPADVSGASASKEFIGKLSAILDNHRNWPPPETQPLHLNLKISMIDFRSASGLAFADFGDQPGALPCPQDLGLNATQRHLFCFDRVVEPRPTR